MYSAALTKRFTPLQLSCPFYEKIKVDLKLAPEFDVISIPNTINLENQIGKVIIASEKTNDAVHLSRELVINNDVVLPEEYPDFRQLIIEWQARDRREVVLKRGNDDTVSEQN